LLSLVPWLLLGVAAPTAARAQREQSIYADAGLTSRYLWRGRDFGSAVLGAGAGIPYWSAPLDGPQYGLLFDTRAWLALGSRDEQKAASQVRLRAQFVATSGADIEHVWEFRAGYAGYALPSALRGAPDHSSEVDGTVTAPMMFERQNAPIRPSLSVGHDFERFDGTRAALGVRQDKEVQRTRLEWSLEVSGSDYGGRTARSRAFGYEATTFALFVGRTPSAMSPGSSPSAMPVSRWREYGVTLAVIAPAGGLSRARLAAGVRLGAGRSTPW
jgi:hypothetical protein